MALQAQFCIMCHVVLPQQTSLICLWALLTCSSGAWLLAQMVPTLLQ